MKLRLRPIYVAHRYQKRLANLTNERAAVLVNTQANVHFNMRFKFLILALHLYTIFDERKKLVLSIFFILLRLLILPENTD